MSRAVGVKKPQETQNAKALWKIKAAKEAGEEYYDPTREDNIWRRNETRLAPWEEHLKDPIVALDSLEMGGKVVLEVSARLGGRLPRNGGRWLPPKCVGKADLGGRLVLLGSDGLFVFTHSFHGVECAREVWALLLDTEGTGNGAGR